MILTADNSPAFYEFFAGGGMARLGLGPEWRCLFANEWSDKKADVYQANFHLASERLARQDVARLAPADLPGHADLAWASFPCQDLSLAGNGAGLKGSRSGTFKPFWSLIESLKAEGRAPGLVVLENVTGALTSRGGKDFAYLLNRIAGAGYRAGALVMDAARFLPQSRPRLFIVAVREDIEIAGSLARQFPAAPWHTNTLVQAYRALPSSLRASWIWWNVPSPAVPRQSLAEIVEEYPADVRWHSQSETARLIAMMSDANLAKLQRLSELPGRQVGTIYKRTRPDPLTGKKVQRAELRCDGIAGCLRTPAGGSSRQILVVVEGAAVRTRLLSPREAARLMGIPDSYALPRRYNDAYHLAGDGLAVPVVSWLSEKLLKPLLSGRKGVVAA
ncbi:MAG TPA: DNA cytosine methyltransferase [Bryobacteraceae bacterium]|nr:DNA cytosine methyltransferase [Bryobacteraceae bacterium]